MTDLRSALREIEHLATVIADEPQGTPVRLAACSRFAEVMRPLLDAPCTVLDALRDPEVRAGRTRIEATVAGNPTQYRFHDGMVYFRSAFNGWQSWAPLARLYTSDLDAPCRLVPVESPPRAPVMTTFECRTCGVYVDGEARPDGFAAAGWSAIDGIDGPNAICPECAAEPTSLDALREDGYPDARVRRLVPAEVDRG